MIVRKRDREKDQVSVYEKKTTNKSEKLYEREKPERERLRERERERELNQLEKES